MVYADMMIVAGVDVDERNNEAKVAAYDLKSGQLQWQYAFKLGGNPCTLEGISEGKVLLCGAQVLCLNASGGKVLWRSDANFRIAGKGALTPEALYLPTTDGIEAVALKDGARTRVMTWQDSRRDRGSLMLADGGFIAYSDRTVTYFVPEKK